MITSIVGIRKLDNTDKHINDPAPWNPNDVEIAKDRAEIFVRKAGLTWCIDCLDVLLKDFFSTFYYDSDVFKLNNKDFSVCYLGKKNVFSDVTNVSYETVYRSVYYKFSSICELLRKQPNLESWRCSSDFRIGKKDKPPYFPELELVIAGVDLAIQWRNNLVHNGIDNSVNQNTIRVLKHEYKEQLNSNEYGTLEADRMIEDFKANSLSFKELAFLIRSVIDFGYILNAYWLNSVNKAEYIEKRLSKIDVKKLKASIYSLSDERRKGSVIMILRTDSVSFSKIDADKKSEEENAIDSFLSQFDLGRKEG